MLVTNPYILILLVTLSVGYVVGEQAAKGIKAVDQKIVHVVKDAGHRIGHLAKKAVGQ